MLQYIIVIIIGIAVVIYFLNKLFKCFSNKEIRKNQCEDCPGCILHPKNGADGEGLKAKDCN